MHVNGTGGRLPTYNAGDPMDRAGSYNSDSIRKDKTEKRRSGFFGLGKKDKDKEVVREKDVSWQLVPIGSWDWRWGVEPSQVVVHNHSLVTRGNALLLDSGGDRDPRLCSHPVAPIDYLALRHQINQAPRQSSSFTVERPNPSQPHVAPPPSQDFQPHAMHRYPDPKGHAPPTPHALHAQHLQQQPQMRNVSSPADGAPSDLAPSTSMPKSQSMGFNRPAPVPETHPYRGYLKAQQEKQMQAEAQAQQQQQQGTLPRSQSMPLNDANGHAAPPLVKEIESPRGGPPAQAAWMKEFDAVVELIGAQPQKTYVASPPELEMILARTSAGGQPK